MKFLQEIHRGVQSTIQQLEIDGVQVARKFGKSESGQAEIAAQTEFYRKISPALRPHYPQLLDADLSTQPPYYTMAYVPFPTMRQLLLESDVEAEYLTKRIVRVLQFLQGVHHQEKTISAPVNYIQQTYWDRAEKRLKNLAEIDSQFQQILDCEEIVINGETLPAPLALIKQHQADASLNARLQPSELVFVHGQAEFAHIMLSETVGDFVLIDPRGWDVALDSSYELGKMLICSGYQHDWIETGQFKIERWQMAENSLKVENFTFDLPHRVQVCQNLHKNLMKNLLGSHDEAWRFRLQLAAAIHLLASTPYCYGLDKNIEKALACYSQGAKALQKFHQLRMSYDSQ